MEYICVLFAATSTLEVVAKVLLRVRRGDLLSVLLSVSLHRFPFLLPDIGLKFTKPFRLFSFFPAPITALHSLLIVTHHPPTIAFILFRVTVPSKRNPWQQTTPAANV